MPSCDVFFYDASPAKCATPDLTSREDFRKAEGSSRDSGSFGPLHGAPK